jgi:hypothetical protein
MLSSCWCWLTNGLGEAICGPARGGTREGKEGFGVEKLLVYPSDYEAERAAGGAGS